MEFILLRQGLVLAAVIISTYTDLKSGMIYDKITYPLIAAGLILSILDFSPNYLLIAGAVFIFGAALYYLGKIGGGDVKLFTGIALTLPFFQGNVFILNMLLAAAISSVIILSTYYVLRYTGTGINFEENKRGILNSSLLGLVIIFYFLAMLQLNLISFTGFLILFIPIIFSLFFLAFQHGIRRNFFLKTVPLSELDEDELIAGT